MSGAGTSTSNQQQQQQSVSNPWGPSQGLLQNILGSLGGQSTGVTQDQRDALANLKNSLAGMQNFGGAASGATAGALGTNTGSQQDMLRQAYSGMQGNLGGYASGQYLNPMNTPGFSDALKTMNSDITNQVRGNAEAMGRSGSPAENTSLARGLSQGESGLIANQYNQNVGNMMGANSALFGGAGATAGGLTQQQLAQLQAQGQGMGWAQNLPGIYGAPGSAMFNAANMGYGLPFQNIGMLEGLVNPIAGLGGQTSGSSSTQGSQTASPLQQFGQAGQGANSWLRFFQGW